MKNLIFFIAFLSLSSTVFSQAVSEKTVKTDVDLATVFIEGAQVTRKKMVELPAGISILKFVGLSPFIDAKSIQVKAGGKVTVMSVNHQQNFLGKVGKPNELSELELKAEQIEKNIKLERTYLEIISEELAFLKENRGLVKNLKDMNVENLKEVTNFYSTSLSSLKLKEIDHVKNIEAFLIQKADIDNQIKTLTSKKEYPTGEILVKVDAKTAISQIFEISYLVSNAGWFPSYDIRAKNIGEPIELVYKANVRQDTKEDWNNVKLSFSSSDPNKTGVSPRLKTYFLDFNSLPPVYSNVTGTIIGKVCDVETREGLPGVNVMVEGTMIGAVTDPNGNYSITVPSNGGNLVFSYIGYSKEFLPITGKVMNVSLVPETSELKEVVIAGYGTLKKENVGALTGSMPGIQVEKNKSIKRVENYSPVITNVVEKQTAINFEVKEPYTILSDNKNYSVVMEAYALPADYQYYCVPKIDKDAFLIAHISNWEKYNLLEGEANIFFEDTYVGKTLLDVRYASDTLKISLGRDKNVSVAREKSKEFTTKQFVGNKKEETRQWMTTVRNNKSQKINMLILDQVPVSTVQEIEVEIQKTSGAMHNAETGEIKWEFILEPQQKKEFELRYSVKSPKNSSLMVE